MDNVVVVGSLNVDLHLLVERHVEPGETVLAGGGAYSPGGKGANQALAAALSGANVTMLGAVGDDGSSALATTLLGRAGVDLSHLAHLAGPTGLAVVSVDAQAENTVVVVPGANAQVTPALIAGWRELIADADVVLLQGEIPAASIQAAVEAAAGQVVVNLAPAIPVGRSVLLAADPLVVNQHEGAAALSLLGGPTLSDPSGIVEALLNAGVPSVVMTLGAAGALVSVEGEVVAVASPRVEAVDTVGAGDAFCGALAARLAAGEPPLHAAAFASRFAASSVQRPGAQSSYPSRREELPEF